MTDDTELRAKIFTALAPILGSEDILAFSDERLVDEVIGLLADASLEIRPKAAPVTEEGLRDVVMKCFHDFDKEALGRRNTNRLVNEIVDAMRRVAHCNSPETE